VARKNDLTRPFYLHDRNIEIKEQPATAPAYEPLQSLLKTATKGQMK